MYKLVKFLVFGAFLCSVIGCGKDDPDETKKPDTPTLLPAFVSVEAVDASILLPGDDATKEITLKANREVEVAVPAEAAEWVTVTAAATDLAASTAKLTITVKKNETAFKGRAVTVSITARKANDGDNVSGASAKASIEIKQSLFGLPTADLFDWKADAAGNVSDVSPNKLAITVGPAKPAITLNLAYGLYEATIEDVSSEKYAADHKLYPAGHRYNSAFEAIGKEKYQAADGEYEVGSKRMSYYKIPWSTNTEGIVKAYKNAFSYELIFQAPEYLDNANTNLFGNVNPTHCGFGINRHNNMINFVSHYSFGSTDRLYHQDADSVDVVIDDFTKYYHVVATVDKSNPTESIVLYVDGVKVNSSANPGGRQLHFPTDYYAMSTGHEHAEADRTPQTEYLCIGGGSHQSGYPSFGAPHNTKIVVARVYGKALNQTEVSALYNYHKPE
jgi:hypothetical protein